MSRFDGQRDFEAFHIRMNYYGSCESFHARFRGEFLSGEIFYSLREAQILIEE